MNRLVAIVALLVTAFGAAGYRRWHARWGATADEATAAMPGDDLFRGAAFDVTRGITIRAEPRAVWPWLVQVGMGRAGFYAYDLLDNLGQPSLDRVLPEHQALAIGDWIPMSTGQPTERTAFRVQSMEAPNSMLWVKPGSSWAWQLTPIVGGRTRLVTRLRCQYDWRDLPGVLVTIPLMELGDFPMMRRMLLGIRQRAERG